jgi:outer membrane protein TolC
MRWKAVFVGLALTLAVTAGCKQQCFMTEADLNGPITTGLLGNRELDPTVGNQPITARVAAPPTVLNLERQIRYVSLAETISIALEQGTVGSGSFANTAPGAETYSDTEVLFNARATFTDSIRILALDPAITGADIDRSLSKFDAVWNTSLSWNVTDRPVASSIDTFQAGGLNSINTEAADVRTSIFKPLPAGGTAGITFDVPYQLTNLPSRVNPAYTPSLEFQFEQPLLQGFGVEINQLRQSHPGSLLLPNGGVLSGLPQPGVDGILITRLRFDQQRAEFQRSVNIMLANVEYSYWNLYNSYWTLYANETALRQAYEAWKIAEVKLQAGKIAIADVAQTRGQYELFRSNRLASLDDVLERERQLRGMLGMPVEDGKRLVPSDSPTLAAYQPDWDTALDEALNNAPSLVIAREEVKANQLNVRLAENFLLPDLRFAATYDVNSIGTHLDGTDANNAFRNLSSDHFNNSSLALRLNVPIGYRNAHANVRIQKLNLARSYETLRTQELKVQRALAKAYRAVFTAYEQIKALRAQREAFGVQVTARFQEFQAGKITPDLLLEAQRFFAQALSSEYSAIRDYNNALTTFELVKGTIPQHDNVVISEAGLPVAAAERAVEHQRKRSIALELRERAAPVSLAESHADNMSVDVPQGQRSQAMPLSDLWQTKRPLLDAPPAPSAATASPSNASLPASSSKKAIDFGTGLPLAPNRVGDLPGTPLPAVPSSLK